MATTTRRGRSKNLTFDDEAISMLEEMCPGPHIQGRFVSELLRREYLRVQQRRRVLQALDETTTAEQEQ